MEKIFSVSLVRQILFFFLNLLFYPVLTLFVDALLIIFAIKMVGGKNMSEFMVIIIGLTAYMIIFETGLIQLPKSWQQKKFGLGEIKGEQTSFYERPLISDFLTLSTYIRCELFFYQITKITVHKKKEVEIEYVNLKPNQVLYIKNLGRKKREQFLLAIKEATENENKKRGEENKEKIILLYIG